MVACIRAGILPGEAAIPSRVLEGFACTPEPPYVAVIFTSRRSPTPDDGYGAATDEMERLAAKQPGYLGIESARRDDGLGITVSYWATESEARAWKRVTEHAEAQRRGRDEWYAGYEVRVATVTRAYGHP